MDQRTCERRRVFDDKHRQKERERERGRRLTAYMRLLEEVFPLLRAGDVPQVADNGAAMGARREVLVARAEEGGEGLHEA